MYVQYILHFVEFLYICPINAQYILTISVPVSRRKLYK